MSNAKPLTGDEIRAAIRHAHNMSGPSDATQPAEYVLAGALALMSKLRAPVGDDLVASLRSMASVAPDSECEILLAAASALASAPAPNQATSGGMFYEGLFEGETERQRDRRLKWMKTMRPASAPVAFYRQSLRDLVDVVWKEATESTAVPDTAWADRLIDKVFPSVLASAPVAGEARDAALWRAYAARFPEISAAFLAVHGDGTPQTTKEAPTDGLAREHALREILAALILEHEDDGITAETLDAARNAIHQPYRAAQASAPVAGEAQNSDSRYAAKSSTYDAARIIKLPTVDTALAAFIENSDGNTALALVQAILDAAPQASEAVRDAALNDAISILLNLSARYRHNYDKEGCNSYHEGGADALDEAEQAIRAALSAQPGAQKPHPKQHNDGGSDE